jgi:EAL domain-containing protein (putative c-di-GMP-specific phosphodiesterase class I)
MAVTHAVLQLARNIGVRVIAEGVETFPQLAVLQSLRCDMAQGYLLGRPMPLGQILAWSRTAVARMAT